MKKLGKKLLSMSMVVALCLMLLPTVFAADTGEEMPLPESVLYYGTIEQIVRTDDGTVSALRLSSERQGEYVMNLSDETVWIDSGKKTISDPATLEVGEAVYICHSAIAAQSLPPQSSAYAIVRDIPQDAGCAQYMTVDAIENKNGAVTITANNETVTFTVDADTTFAPYRTKNIVTLHDLKEGSHIMVWYSYSRDMNERTAAHIMLLPDSADKETAEESGCKLLSFWKNWKF